MESNIFSLFAVPFVHVRHPEEAALNQALRAHILSAEAQGNRYRNPSPAMAIPDRLFESTFEFFASREPCVQQLKAFCFFWLKKTIGDLSNMNAAELDALTVHSHTWFHVSRSGAYFSMHNHPMASWSGVYCVSPGDGEGADNGAISFLHPFGAANMFVDRGNARMRLPFAAKNFMLRQQAGELILFPSHLFHQVMPYVGQTERITVAFNCWFPG